jgi:hypothetical protein
LTLLFVALQLVEQLIGIGAVHACMFDDRHAAVRAWWHGGGPAANRS